ncbi:MAG: beta-lactamase family protein [Bryobacterales bacterium]|nr:beta-lactamase family protein [Bryobacterales bacterium]
MIRFLLAVSSLCWAQQPAVTQNGNLPPQTIQRIEAVFAKWNSPKSGGCAVSVRKGNGTPWQRGFGMANLEHDIPVTPQSTFYLGSTSKQFTAMTVLLLAERGKLRLEDPVRRWLPQLPEYLQPVTIRHLLEHTSGIRDYITLWNLTNPQEDAALSEPAVSDILFRQKELNFAPGTEFLYSNSGYFLLSQIVRPAALRHLADLADETVFRPLGMGSTRFYGDRFSLLPRRATGYSPMAGQNDMIPGTVRINSGTLDVTGDGGVFTSLEDFEKWDRVLASPQALFANAVTQMMTPVSLPSGDKAEYGMGLMLRNVNGYDTVSHMGGLRGYRSDILRIPSENTTIICLCNSSDADAGALARLIMEMILPPRKPAEIPKLSAAELKRKAGAFQDRLTGDLLQIMVQNDMLIGDFNGFRMPLIAETPMRFRGAGGPLRFEVEFRKNGDAEVPRFLRNEAESHRETAFERVQLMAAPADLAQYEGRFYSDEARATLEVQLRDGNLELSQQDRAIGRMQPTTADRFHLGALNVEYVRNAAKSIEGLRLNTGRVRHLLFTKAK